jgi:TolA-binding protein
MIKRFSMHFCACFGLLLVSLLLSSCGGSKSAVESEELQRTEDDLRRREQDVQKKTIEILDLKNQIIILQSEISELKSNIIDLESHRDSMRSRLMKEKMSAEELESMLSELDEKNLELKRQNELLQSYLSASQDSIRKTLEDAAVKESEQNLLKAITFEDTVSDEEKSSMAVADSQAMDIAITPVMNLTQDEYLQRYQDALDLLFDKQRNKAIEEFRELIRLSPDNDYSDNCQYWIGEGYYAQGMYERAIREFEEVKEFPSGNKADHAQFKIGLSYLKLGRQVEGLEAFKKLLEVYPESELVGKVREILDSGQF